MYFFTIPQLSQQQGSGIQNVWYEDYYGPAVDVNTFDTPLPDLYVIATVNTGESLHILFTADAYFTSGAGIEFVNVHVKLNGYIVPVPNAMFGAQNAITIWTELTLSYTNISISPGAYNVSIIASAPGSTALKQLYDMTLLAYTFK
jgi:hypothetical protein